jgi:hypothetical protein
VWRVCIGDASGFQNLLRRLQDSLYVGSARFFPILIAHKTPERFGNRPIRIAMPCATTYMYLHAVHVGLVNNLCVARQTADF